MNDDGLKKIVYENGEYKVQSFHSNAGDNNSLSSDRLRCLFEDRQGILWIGSTVMGMNKYNLASHVFNNLGIHNSGTYGLNSDIILSFLQLEKEKILVGTREKGVYLLNSTAGQFIKPENYFNPLRDKSVSTMFIDSRDILWIRTWDALYYLIPQSNELLEIKEIEEDIDGICEDDFGSIWLGTRSGLKKLNIGKDNYISGIENYSLEIKADDSPIIAKVLYNDPFDHTLWLGTFHKGLINIDVSNTYKESGTVHFRQYTSGMEAEENLQSNFVSSILRTSEDDIWVGTEGGGISHGKFTSEGIRFSTYNEESGLSNNAVKAILEDESGNLWISTNKGLNKFLKDSGQFVVYDRYDGLPSDYFTSAALLMSDKRMIMGGNQGLTLFNPAEIKDNPIPPIPEFGSFQLFYQTVLPLETINNKILLPKSIAETDHLKLAHNQNTFSFELLALHLSNPRTNRLKYKLHGFDEDWIYYNKGNTFANYAKVKPGRYTFEFFAANSHGQWSSESKRIELSIKPPIWWNKYVIVFYAALVIAVFLLLLRNSRRILDLKHKVEIEEIESLKTSELNESKLKFFMNVSHEFKTPISLITGPVQYLQKYTDGDSRFKSYLSLIRNQTDYLLNLLDQLVYFRKAESETLELKCQYLDIIPFIDNIKKSYEWQSTEQRIDLNYVHPDTEIMLWIDPKSMDKIIHNLISNAFKYSRQGSRITLAVYPDMQEDRIHISVKDTGIGIAAEKIPQIFERFYQENSSIGGYGIGLSLVKTLVELHKGTISVSSIPGQGTDFIVTLLIGKDHLEDDQISNPVELEDPVSSSPERENMVNRIIAEQPGINDTGYKSLVMIVEDNVRMLKFLKDVLSDDFRLVTAFNGLEAVELMKSDFPDLILSDVMMPEMDGIELCDRVKTDVLTCHIPVVLLSAKSDIESRINGLEHGADYYIPKPVDIDLLQAELKSVLYNRNKIKERIGLKLPFDISSEDLHPMDKDLLMKVKAVAEDNFSDPGFDSNQFSKKVFINRSLFYKKMKALTNQTPSEFLRAFRMNKAVELMVKEKVPVSEVNLSVGIQSRSHFTKCFKETFGTLPSQFLKNTRGNKEINL